jgi:signal transduction histidine kinase
VREIDENMRQRVRNLPVAPLLERLGFNSWMIVPLASGGRTFGVISFVSSGDRRYDEHDLLTAAELGRRAASAVDNARLFRDAQAARRAAEEEQRRTSFLSDVSAALAASLDYESMLQHVAQLVVEGFGDWCAINLRESDESDLRRVVLRHRDPSKRDVGTRFLTHPVRPDQSRVVRDVVRSAEPQLFTQFDPHQWDRYADDPEFRDILADLGIESMMVVPLLTGGRAFGAVSIVSSDPLRRYDANDLAVAVELGRRAASAIDNARLYREARDANRAKDEFLATLSHELRTPMTATLGWASMLRMADVSRENFAMAVETIERSTKAQAKLIDEILDVSRIITGKLELAVAPLNLTAIIEAAIDAIRPSLIAKNLTLYPALGRVTGLAMGDSTRLQQVIWNLLSNSVKFTPSNGAIYLSLESVGRAGAAADAPASPAHAVRITVRDTGQGIPARFLPYIFERFRQADSSSTRAHGGLGLGLAIVKNIVELHGGTVVAQSEGEGKGATFIITLPLVVAPAASAPQPAHRTGSVTLDGISILLVEDEDDTRHMLAAALESFGARVTAVSSVPDALAALQAQPPHVIISDIGLPGEDGYSFMAKLRTSDVRTPAIALTAYARTEDRDRILASGFARHLAKPVDPEVMAKLVREMAGTAGSA